MAASSQATSIPVRRRSRRLRQYIIPFLFITPWMLGVLIYYAYPLLASLYFSFTYYDVLRPPVWAGLANYRELLNNVYFHLALSNTLIYVAVAVPLALFVGIVQAILLNIPIRGQPIFRTLALAPGAVPISAGAAIWVFLWNPAVGLINGILRSLHLPTQNWIANPDMVKWVFISMAILGGMGMLVFLAGLQSVPESLYDSAKIDGASSIQRFRNITIPMLTPSLLYNILLGLIGAFQYFTFPMMMTNGGPINGSKFFGQYLYESAFQDFKMGYAAAQAWILFIICVVIVYAVFRSSARWVYYAGE
jgi:multiple sugar transport system permease protein